MGMVTIFNWRAFCIYGLFTLIAFDVNAHSEQSGGIAKSLASATAACDAMVAAHNPAHSWAYGSCVVNANPSDPTVDPRAYLCQRINTNEQYSARLVYVFNTDWSNWVSVGYCETTFNDTAYNGGPTGAKWDPSSDTYYCSSDQQRTATFNYPDAGNKIYITGCEYDIVQGNIYINNQDGTVTGVIKATGNYGTNGGTVESTTNDTPHCTTNNGLTVCPDANAAQENGLQNCGTYNGDYVCVENITSGCQQTSNGGSICVTSQEGFTPNGTVTTTDGQQYDYYDQTNPPPATTGGGGTGGGTGGDGGAGNGTGETPPEEDYNFTQAKPTDDIGQGKIVEVYGQYEQIPIVNAIKSITANMPAGNCPAPTIDIFGSTITIDQHCALQQSLAGLEAVMLAAWSLLGVRIIMSA